MPVVASFDWVNRRIYMAAADWHPIDVYREHRDERQVSEEARKYDPLMRYSGNIAKGGGKFTPRFATMLDGAKIVPVDGGTAPVTTITGEIITDDASEFIDVAPLTVKPLVKYQPPEAEIIQVVTGSAVTSQDKVDIADEVLVKLGKSLKRGEAVACLHVVMRDSDDHVTPKAGLSLAVSVVKDSGSWAPLAGSAVEIGNGVYHLALTAGEMDAEIVTVYASAPGADPQVITLVTASS